MSGSAFAHLRTELPARYPRLFAEMHRPESSMSWGMAIGDGWLPLVGAVCETITALQTSDDAPRFQQVKEKMGGLRIYVSGGNPAQQEVTALSGELSYRLCEQCGAPGRLSVRGGYYQTLCTAHAAGEGAKFVSVDPDLEPPASIADLAARHTALASTDFNDVPEGWREVLHALAAEVARKQPGKPCRRIARRLEGRAEIEWPGLDDSGKSAVALVQALLPRVDPVTGALLADGGAP